MMPRAAHGELPSRERINVLHVRAAHEHEREHTTATQLRAPTASFHSCMPSLVSSSGSHTVIHPRGSSTFRELKSCMSPCVPLGLTCT